MKKLLDIDGMDIIQEFISTTKQAQIDLKNYQEMDRELEDKIEEIGIEN
jgi:hypothetical protein